MLKIKNIFLFFFITYPLSLRHNSISLFRIIPESFLWKFYLSEFLISNPKLYHFIFHAYFISPDLGVAGKLITISPLPSAVEMMKTTTMRL